MLVVGTRLPGALNVPGPVWLRSNPYRCRLDGGSREPQNLNGLAVAGLTNTEACPSCADYTRRRRVTVAVGGSSSPRRCPARSLAGLLGTSDTNAATWVWLPATGLSIQHCAVDPGLSSGTIRDGQRLGIGQGGAPSDLGRHVDVDSVARRTAIWLATTFSADACRPGSLPGIGIGQVAQGRQIRSNGASRFTVIGSGSAAGPDLDQALLRRLDLRPGR